MARDFYTGGCRGANKNACNGQIYMLPAGLGGPADLPTALSIAQIHCVNNQPAHICAKLGEMLYNGIAGQADKARGISLLTAACTARILSACTHMQNSRENRAPEPLP
jgi:TPR repeat protein